MYSSKCPVCNKDLKRSFDFVGSILIEEERACPDQHYIWAWNTGVAQHIFSGVAKPIFAGSQWADMSISDHIKYTWALYLTKLKGD